MASIKQEQSAFEAWAKKRQFDVCQTLSGVYDNAMTHQLWGVWLARAEALIVSTHSRPKAAGFKKRRPKPPKESFNSQPPEGGWVRLPHGKKPPSRFNSQPPEGGWMLPATRQMVLQRFNSQPPEGGWITC